MLNSRAERTGTTRELAAAGLSFKYRRDRTVFTDLSWTLETGSRVVLLGPNGAGKTTLMKLLSGVLETRMGSITIRGERVERATLRRQVALMPQHVEAVPRLSVQDQLKYAAWLNKMPLEEATARSLEVLHSVALQDAARQRSDQLSGGQLRRLGLAQALIRQSGFLMLDEPTAGLDPAQRSRFRETLSALPADVGLVVSTHETHDIADLFDRVCILDKGRFLYDGDLEGLARTTGHSSVDDAYLELIGRS